MATLLCNSGAYTIVGSPSVTNWGILAATGSYAMTGTAATTRHGYVVTASGGAYAVTGDAIGVGRLAAEPGAYLLTGQSADLLYLQRILVASGGSYAVTGGDAGLMKSVPAAIGSYAVTGTAATLSRSGFPVLAAESGSYTLSGTAAALESELLIGAGEYTITGTAATLNRGNGAFMNSGTYAISAGPQALLKATRIFRPINSGAYAIAGQEANLVYSGSTAKVVVALPGTYALTGAAAVVSKAGYLEGSYEIVGSAVGLSVTLNANSSSYAMTGTAAALRHDGTLAANSGSYTVTGVVAGLHSPVARLDAQAGHYAVAGLQANLVPHQFVIAEQSHYAITGTDVFLRSTHFIAEAGAYHMNGTAANVTSDHTSRWQTYPKLPSSKQAQPPTDPSWDGQVPEPGIEV